EPDPAHRHIRRHVPQEGREIRTVARCEVELRGAPYVPRRMAAHRLVAPHALHELLRDGEHQLLLRSGRSAAKRSCSLCATALMLPAPMVTITSPSRMTSFSDSASSSTRSTNSGSTCPRARTARHIPRPAPAAI